MWICRHPQDDKHLGFFQFDDCLVLLVSFVWEVATEIWVYQCIPYIHARAKTKSLSVPRISLFQSPQAGDYLRWHLRISLSRWLHIYRYLITTINKCTMNHYEPSLSIIIITLINLHHSPSPSNHYDVSSITFIINDSWLLRIAIGGLI